MEHDRYFNGVIRQTVKNSTTSWIASPTALKRSPNVVLIVLDDVGYAQLGSYGSDIETPALDSLADDGLRYANFHVTPLCSPTRACLLTGSVLQMASAAGIGIARQALLSVSGVCGWSFTAPRSGSIRG